MSDRSKEASGASAGPRPSTQSSAKFDGAALLRRLPGVDELLRAEPLQAAVAELGRELVLEHCRQTLAERRSRILTSSKTSSETSENCVDLSSILGQIAESIQREQGSGLVRAINATGVVLHTGLGRAPVAPSVAERMAEAARSYCVLEVDRYSGQRNRRDDQLSRLMARLTGAEAAICVNNCAAAVVLTLNTFASDREVPVSRGELVEIGGSFRMPDVMERAGSKLVEVGTTNRTRIGDFEAALSSDTGLLMKVHTSNYRVQGFTESVTPTELAELGQRNGVTVAYDLGSGLCADDQAPLDMLQDEAHVQNAVQSGVDVVLFSGDKLLGGPQAGILAGRKAAVESLRKNPLYRALRLDKVAIAGLEATCELLLRERANEIPARALIRRPLREIEEAAQRIAQSINGLDGFKAQCEASQSQPGSGTAPCVFLDTFAVRVHPQNCSAEQLGQKLRATTPPIYGRIQEDSFWLDPRTLLPGDEEQLLQAFTAL